MNINEMMMMMDAKLEADRIEAEVIAEREEMERQLMVGELLDEYGKRIDDIIALLRYCIAKGIEFPKGKYRKYYEPWYNDFESDGIRHHFGGVCFSGKDLSFLGWYNGGACGSYDILANGSCIMAVHEDRRRYRDVKKEELVRFKRDFIEFEGMVMDWFVGKLA